MYYDFFKIAVDEFQAIIIDGEDKKETLDFINKAILTLQTGHTPLKQLNEFTPELAKELLDISQKKHESQHRRTVLYQQAQLEHIRILSREPKLLAIQTDEKLVTETADQEKEQAKEFLHFIGKQIKQNFVDMRMAAEQVLQCTGIDLTSPLDKIIEKQVQEHGNGKVKDTLQKIEEAKNMFNNLLSPKKTECEPLEDNDMTMIDCVGLNQTK